MFTSEERRQRAVDRGLDPAYRWADWILRSPVDECPPYKPPADWVPGADDESERVSSDYVIAEIIMLSAARPSDAKPGDEETAEFAEDVTAGNPGWQPGDAVKLPPPRHRVPAHVQDLRPSAVPPAVARGRSGHRGAPDRRPSSKAGTAQRSRSSGDDPDSSDDPPGGWASRTHPAEVDERDASTIGQMGRIDLLNVRYRLNVGLEWLGDGAYEDAAAVFADLLHEIDQAIALDRRAA